MHAQSLVALLALSSTALASPAAVRKDLGPRAELFAQLDTLAASARKKTLDNIKSGDLARCSNTCNPSNLRVRKEWSNLSKPEKLSYIAAVKCLRAKPPLTPSSLAEGTKTRYDDFITTHINQTNTIHYTGNFLSWHRYFVHLYEEALRNECGYKGAQPYWDWTKTAETSMETYPIWDGSETSLGGNGEFVPNKGPILVEIPGLPSVPLPTGNGGGCVTTGPFGNMTMNLGPVSLPVPGPMTLGPINGNPLAYNPRCLKRDLTTILIAENANVSSVVDLITKWTTLKEFQETMQGDPGRTLGVHGSGHMSQGGDPGMDVYTSPGDPVFYLHHGMIDKVWWMWQMAGGDERILGDQAIAGTRTMLNNPPSDNATLEDYLEYGFAAGPPRQIKELMSTTTGPLCYTYE